MWEAEKQGECGEGANEQSRNFGGGEVWVEDERVSAPTAGAQNLGFIRMEGDAKTCRGGGGGREENLAGWRGGEDSWAERGVCVSLERGALRLDAPPKTDCCRCATATDCPLPPEMSLAEMSLALGSQKEKKGIRAPMIF